MMMQKHFLPSVAVWGLILLTSCLTKRLVKLDYASSRVRKMVFAVFAMHACSMT